MNGREAFNERFGFKVKGEFHCQGWFEIPLTIVGLALIPGGGIPIFRFLADPSTAFGGSFASVPLALAAWALFCWWIVRIAHIGVVFRYEGDDNEFRITDNKKHTEIFYYPDVVKIDYKPITYVNKKLRGYKVTVHTKYRSVTYRYIAYGHQRINTPQDTPFFELQRQSGLADGAEAYDDIQSRV